MAKTANGNAGANLGFKATLWSAADKLRGHMDAAEYSHQRVKPEYLLAMDMEIPPTEAIQQYTKAAAPLHQRIALNLQESRTLAALRDALLPKLLSGAVRVREGKK